MDTTSLLLDRASVLAGSGLNPEWRARIVGWEEHILGEPPHCGAVEVHVTHLNARVRSEITMSTFTPADEDTPSKLPTAACRR